MLYVRIFGNWKKASRLRILSSAFCGIIVNCLTAHVESAPAAPENSPIVQESDALSHQSETSPASEKSKKLDEIVVVATRTAQEKNKVAASVSTYSAEDIVNGNLTSPQDLVRNEVGVSANRSMGGGGRAERTATGVEDYNIRGLTGNRILLIEDGIRAPDIFSFRGNVADGRAFYDFDSLKRIELIKSAASTLYGSGAIGGVVSYTTKDPADFLAHTTRPFYLSYKQSFDSADLSLGETATAAARTGPVEYLILYTRRDGQEQGISADLRKYGPAGANPLSYHQNNLLGKVVYHLNEKNQLRFTGEYFNSHGNSDLISQTNVYSKQTRTTDLTTADTENRGRVSLDYQFTGDSQIDLFKNIQSTLFFQVTESKQDSEQVQDSARGGKPFAGNQTIYRNEYYRTYHMGGNLQATQLAHAFGLVNEWTYGGEVTYTLQDRFLNGRTVEKATGKSVPADSTQLYPQAEIPPSGTLRLGVFAQDQITPEKVSWLRLTPALRMDYYSLNIHNSDAYLRASYGTPGVSYQRFSITPSFSTLIQATRNLNFYGNFAEGFRNPNTEDLNLTFGNPFYGYEVLPNPALKPEQSYDFEIGTRGDYPFLKFSFSGFYHYYNDFITFDTAGKIDPKNPSLIVYRGRNISRAQIYGIEGNIEVPLGYYVSWLEGFYITTACAYTVGDDLESRYPLANIDPFKIVNTLSYRDPSNKWDVSLIGTWVATQTRLPDPQKTPIGFNPPSYYTVDLVGRFRFNKNALLTFGIYNLTNQTYWLYQNMSSPEVVSSSYPTGIARFSEPGINARISFSLSF
ncbi:MAG: hypothetical protein C5B47_07150 [Verrucomicrobia bacterium]|nr:MAG: hypothetical protein C5B47_07150 [Verrucomicrobiota bacterium]